MKRRITTALAAAFLVAASGTQAGAAEATAAALCDPPYYRNVSDGWAITDGTQNMKVAPYASCGNTASVANRTYIYIWCFKENSEGYFWVYGRAANTQKRGWLRLNDFYRYDYGSTGLAYC